MYIDWSVILDGYYAAAYQHFQSLQAMNIKMKMLCKSLSQHYKIECDHKELM